jgi:acylphosphatase
VQGVFYRDTCRRLAIQNSVSGSATNLHDGRVEIVLEGDPGAVERVLAWCREGTPQSSVSSVEVIEEAPEGTTGFITS